MTMVFDPALTQNWDPGQLMGPVAVVTGVKKIYPADFDAQFVTPSRWVIINDTGSINVTQLDGTTITVPIVSSGWYLWTIQQINTTGTTISESDILWAI